VSWWTVATLPAIPLVGRWLPVVTATSASIIVLMTGRDSSGRKDRRDQESLERRHFGYCLRLDFLVLVEAGLGYAMSDNERPAQEFNCSASSSRMNEQTCTKKARGQTTNNVE
jgi:hypothetical protein